MAYAGSRDYWCHRCSRTVRLNGSSEMICPDCQEGFLEEMEAPAAESFGHPVAGLAPGNYQGSGNWNVGDEVGNAEGFPSWQALRQAPRGNDSTFAQLLETMSSLFQQMQAAQFARGAGQEEHMRLGVENPMFVLQGQLQNLRGEGNVGIFYDDGTGAGPRRLPGNSGDYFLGPGFEQLIQQLAENDPNRYGTPPAAKSAVEAMPTITIVEEHLGTDAAQCAVCKDEFELGEKARQMPCKHIYHSDCILPWLAQHNSCPICRYELPTDDTEYDQSGARWEHGPMINSEASGGTQGGGETPGRRGGLTIWGTPGTLTMRRLSGTGEGRNAVDPDGQDARSGALDNAEMSSVPQRGSGGASANASASGGGVGSLFSFSFPWLFGSSTAARGESSGQANTVETVSSTPSGEGNDTSAQNSSVSRTDDDGDILMSEAQQEDLN
eukprot:c27374_g3_i1 orf=578-1894(-)